MIARLIRPIRVSTCSKVRITSAFKANLLTATTAGSGTVWLRYGESATPASAWVQVV